MKLLLIAALLATANGVAQGPPGRLTNTFVTGAETVINDATAIDIAAPDASFNPLMDQLKTAAANLKQMAADESAAQDAANDAVDAANDLVFAVSACHIQANYGADTAKCQVAILDARNRAMISISRHKADGAWVQGPPA